MSTMRVNVPTGRQQRRLHRPYRVHKYRFLPIFISLVAVVSWTSVWIAWMKTHTTTNTPRPLQSMQRSGPSIKTRLDENAKAQRLRIRDSELSPHNLQHRTFFETLKSCLPAESGEKCKQFIPDIGMERIGILSPPGAISDIFESFIDDVLKVHLPYNNRSLEVFKTTHVPPYGYGKTHGFTKFIRLATMPLMLAASDLLMDQVIHGIVHTTDIGVADLSQAVRQVVRWHCRLSHVAAHTAIMTITLEDLMKDPWKEEYQVRLFLNLLNQKDDKKTASLEQHLSLNYHINQDRVKHSMFEIVHRSTNLVMRLDDMMRFDVAPHEKSNVSSIRDLMDSIILDELETTHHLKDWPCKSFWDLDAATAKITEISKRTAARFAPNCTFPGSHCWVPRDFCEVEGDVQCSSPKGK